MYEEFAFCQAILMCVKYPRLPQAPIRPLASVPPWRHRKCGTL